MRGAKTPATTLATLLVAIALLPASFTGSAWHVEDTPDLLHAGGDDGPGWAMYRFDPNDQHVVIDLEVPAVSDTPAVEIAMMFYDEDLALRSGIVATAMLRDDGTYVNSTIIGDDGALVNTYSDFDRDGFFALGAQINAPGTENLVEGTHYVAMWAAGGIARHHHAFYGADGVELYEITEGSSAYYYTTKDFEGPLTARVPAGLAAARAVVDGTVEHTIEGNLLGIFFSGTPLPAADVLSVENPDGSTDTCRCSWTHLTGPNANGPGTYTLAATGVAATFSGSDHVRASVVDVQIPNQNL